MKFVLIFLYNFMLTRFKRKVITWQTRGLVLERNQNCSIRLTVAWWKLTYEYNMEQKLYIKFIIKLFSKD